MTQTRSIVSRDVNLICRNRPSYRLNLAGTILLFAIALSACKPSSDVVSGGIFQARKYRKGINVDIRTPFKRASEKVALSDGQDKGSMKQVGELPAPEGQVFNNDISKSPESVAQIFKKPLQVKSAVKLQNIKWSREEIHAKMVSRQVRLQVGQRSVDPDENENASMVLSQLAKLFAGLSVLTGVGALVLYILLVFSVGPFTAINSGILLVLLTLVAASIVFIGLSLLFSYIVSEKYGDEEAMGWTLVASYILEICLVIFSYILYLAFW